MKIKNNNNKFFQLNTVTFRYYTQREQQYTLSWYLYCMYGRNLVPKKKSKVIILTSWGPSLTFPR